MPTTYTGTIAEVKLPNGELYEIKDAYARTEIEKLANATNFLGVTTTALTDGATTNPIKIGTKDVTAKKGDIAVQASDGTTDGGAEFIFDGTAWYQFGDVGTQNLGALAFKASASGSFTPNVTGSKGTLAVSQATIASATQPITFGTTAVTGATAIKTVDTTSEITYVTDYETGTPSFVGTSATLDVTGTATGDITVTMPEATTTQYKVAVPASTWVTGGSYSKITGATATGGAVTLSKDTIYGLSAAGSVVTTLPTFTPSTVSVISALNPTTTANIFGATVSNETLTLTAVAGGVTANETSIDVLGSATTFAAGTTTTLTSKTFATDVSSVTQPTINLTSSTTAITTQKNTATTLALSSVTTGGTTLVTSTPTTATATGVSLDVTGTTESYTPAGTVTIPALKTATATAINALSTIYGKVVIPAHTHTHTLSGDIVVTPATTSVTVS